MACVVALRRIGLVPTVAASLGAARTLLASEGFKAVILDFRARPWWRRAPLPMRSSVPFRGLGVDLIIPKMELHEKMGALGSVASGGRAQVAEGRLGRSPRLPIDPRCRDFDRCQRSSHARAHLLQVHSLPQKRFELAVPQSLFRVRAQVARHQDHGDRPALGVQLVHEPEPSAPGKVEIEKQSVRAVVQQHEGFCSGCDLQHRGARVDLPQEAADPARVGLVVIDDDELLIRSQRPTPRSAFRKVSGDTGRTSTWSIGAPGGGEESETETILASAGQAARSRSRSFAVSALPTITHSAPFSSTAAASLVVATPWPSQPHRSIHRSVKSRIAGSGSSTTIFSAMVRE